MFILGPILRLLERVFSFEEKRADRRAQIEDDRRRELVAELQRRQAAREAAREAKP